MDRRSIPLVMAVCLGCNQGKETVPSTRADPTTELDVVPPQVDTGWPKVDSDVPDDTDDTGLDIETGETGVLLDETALPVDSSPIVVWDSGAVWWETARWWPGDTGFSGWDTAWSWDSAWSWDTSTDPDWPALDTGILASDSANSSVGADTVHSGLFTQLDSADTAHTGDTSE
jgi:hypothetical protein